MRCLERRLARRELSQLCLYHVVITLILPAAERAGNGGRASPPWSGVSLGNLPGPACGTWQEASLGRLLAPAQGAR